MAYEKVSGPLGQARDDHLAALISAHVVNALKSKGDPIDANELIPDWDSGVILDGFDS